MGISATYYLTPPEVPFPISGSVPPTSIYRWEALSGRPNRPKAADAKARDDRRDQQSLVHDLGGHSSRRQLVLDGLGRMFSEILGYLAHQLCSQRSLEVLA